MMEWMREWINMSEFLSSLDGDNICLLNVYGYFQSNNVNDLLCFSNYKVWCRDLNLVSNIVNK